MKIGIIIHRDKLAISAYNKAKLKQLVVDAGKPIRAEIHTLLPESRKMRKYVMGGLMKLLVYLDGNDHRDGDVCERYFNYYKQEFTPEVMVIEGKERRFGKSSKGSEALRDFAEKLQDHLAEQYGIERTSKAVNPEEYKRFENEIYMQGQYEDYIDYLVKNNLIAKP